MQLVFMTYEHDISFDHEKFGFYCLQGRENKGLLAMAKCRNLPDLWQIFFCTIVMIFPRTLWNDILELPYWNYSIMNYEWMGFGELWHFYHYLLLLNSPHRGWQGVLITQLLLLTGIWCLIFATPSLNGTSQ